MNGVGGKAAEATVTAAVCVDCDLLEGLHVRVLGNVDLSAALLDKQTKDVAKQAKQASPAGV